jgi:hypothetical protein
MIYLCNYKFSDVAPYSQIYCDVLIIQLKFSNLDIPTYLEYTHFFQEFGV